LKVRFLPRSPYPVFMLVSVHWRSIPITDLVTTSQRLRLKSPYKQQLPIVDS
jgi:hypothetical protein